MGNSIYKAPSSIGELKPGEHFFLGKHIIERTQNAPEHMKLIPGHKGPDGGEVNVTVLTGPKAGSSLNVPPEVQVFKTY